MTTTAVPSRYTKEEGMHPCEGGHSGCPGCGMDLAWRLLLKALGGKIVLVWTPGCAAGTSRNISFSYRGEEIFQTSTLFGQSGSYAGGLKTALTLRGYTEYQVVPWIGDGGTFDIGLQTLSGAAERNEDIIYVCYDNEGYMNTGRQRSSATPWQVPSTTSPLPAPKVEPKKDIMSIVAAHYIPYAATATVAYPEDLMRKARKAKEIKGFRFLHFLTPCTTGWQYLSELTIEISRLAVESKIFPLFEVENGVNYTINKEPKGIPVAEYIKMQGRYRHFTPQQIDEFQASVEERWNRLQGLAKLGLC